MVVLICPSCGSTNVKVLEVAPDFRPAKLKCAMCGIEAHITYPPTGQKASS